MVHGYSIPPFDNSFTGYKIKKRNKEERWKWLDRLKLVSFFPQKFLRDERRIFFEENFHEIEVSFPVPHFHIYIYSFHIPDTVAGHVAEASNETLLIDLLFSAGILYRDEFNKRTS